MRKVGYIVSALLLLAVALGPAFAQQPFSDVPTNHWAYNAVNTLAEQGLLEGYPDGTFKGKQSLTRYEFANAIARMMDRMEQMGGVPGLPGPPGPPGPGVGAGLTPEQQAMLDKLAKEFGPELKALRSDLDALTKRVEDLEAMPEPELPKISASGIMSWRAGLYGTDFGTEDVATTGYAFAPIIVPIVEDDVAGIMAIPVSDGLKDAYKAGDFMSQRTRVTLSGELSEDLDVNVSLLAGPGSNELFRPDALAFDQGNSLAMASPLFETGNGLMDVVSIDEAWVKWKTQFITAAEITVGKQYFKRGVGLLADNDQQAIKAFRIDWMTDSLSWGAMWGMLDREMFFGTSAGLPWVWSASMYDDTGLVLEPAETNGQDNYNMYTLNWNISDNWSLGGTWLESGFNKESGWSADLAGKAFGLEWYGEYAQLLDWPTGDDFNDLNGDGVEDPDEVSLDDSDAAWLAGVKWSSDFVNLTGEYGEVDAGYAFAFTGGGWSAFPGLALSMSMYGDEDLDVMPGYFALPLSALHPLAEVNPHFINWVDRPLFLDPTNIARGWHVNLTFPNLLGEGTPLSVSYMAGDGYDPGYLGWLAAGGSNSGVAEPDKWRDADPVWVVKLSRQFTENVSGNVLYGRREVDNVMTSALASDEDIHLAQDPIQVIRAEVCVAF